MSTVTGDMAEFKVSLDMKQFNPEDFKVKTVGNYLIIEGSHQERDEKEGGGFIERHFVRKYLLPEGVDVDHIDCNLGPDGNLMVHAPKLPLGGPAREKEIPIKTVGMPVGEEQKGVSGEEVSRDVPITRRHHVPRPEVGQESVGQQVGQPSVGQQVGQTPVGQQVGQPPVGQQPPAGLPKEVGGQFQVKLPPGTIEKMVTGQMEGNVPGGKAGKLHEGKPEQHVTFADVHAPRAEHHVPRPEVHTHKGEHHVPQVETHEMPPAERHHVARAEQHLARAEHHVARAEHHVEVAEHVAEAEQQVPKPELQKAELHAGPEVSRVEQHHVSRAEEITPSKPEHHIPRAELHTPRAEHHLPKPEHHEFVTPEPDFEQTLKEQRSKLHHVPPPKMHVPQLEQQAPFADIKLQHVAKPEHHMPQPEGEGVHHGVQAEHVPEAELVSPHVSVPEHHIPSGELPSSHIPAPEHHIPSGEEHVSLSQKMTSHVPAPEHHVPEAELGQQHIPQGEGQQFPAVLQHVPLVRTQGPSVDQPSLTAQVHAPIAERHVAMAEHHLNVAEHHLAVAERHVEPILREELQGAASGFIPLPQQQHAQQFQGPSPVHVLPIPVGAPVGLPTQSPIGGHAPSMESQWPMGEQHLPSMESKWSTGEQQHVPSMESQWPMGERHVPSMGSEFPMESQFPMGEQHIPSTESKWPLPEHHEAGSESHVSATEHVSTPEHTRPMGKTSGLSEGFSDLKLGEKSHEQGGESVQEILASQGGIGTEKYQPVEQGEDYPPLGVGLSGKDVEGDVEMPSAPPREEERSSKIIQSTGASPGSMPLGGTGLSDMPLGETGLGREAPLEHGQGDVLSGEGGLGEDLSTSRAFGDESKPSDIGQQDIFSSGDVGQKDISSPGGIGQEGVSSFGDVGQQDISSFGDIGQKDVSSSRGIDQPDVSFGDVGRQDIPSRDIGQHEIPTSGGIGHQEIPSISSEQGGVEQQPMDVSQGQTEFSKDVIHQGLGTPAPLQMEQPVGGMDIRQLRPPMSGMTVSPAKPGVGMTVTPGQPGSPATGPSADIGAPSSPKPMEPTLIVKMQPSGMSATLLPPGGPKTGTMDVGGVSMDISTQTAQSAGSQLEQRQAGVGGERSI